MMIWTEDQRMLADTVAPLLADEGAISKQLRHWRDIGCKDGFGHGLWSRFAELGLSGMMVAEARGGAGMGQVEANILLEEIGRNLTPSPFLMSGVVAARALGGSAAGERWLPGIVAGTNVAALAIDEGPRHDPARIAATASRDGNGYRLDGSKSFVVQGASADVVLVAARADDEIALFAVPRDAAGLSVENVTLADASKAARLVLDGVRVDADARLDAGAPDRALAAGRCGAAAELNGLAAGAAAMTVDYLKQRKQFGRLIGEFQALQHRAAHLWGEIEIARAATLKAAQLLDAGDAGAARMVAVAKAKAGSVSKLAVQEAVQMHGGIGMTDEHDIGFYMKRQAVLDPLLGDPRFHAAAVRAA